MAKDYECLTWESLDDGTIVRLMLNRPEKRNGMSRRMLLDLDAGLRAAEADDQVRVVIVGGNGPVFSAGHDLSGDPKVDPSFTVDGGTREGVEKRYLQEWHYYFQNTVRWRNLRKITIAQVQGGVYAAALSMMWACDLIVASDDTVFADMVPVRFGNCTSSEYFAHPWELGPRKTKELLLTGDSLDVHEAHALGMVSKVFPRSDLAELTLAFARRIAKLPTVTALLVKESVNQTVDNMGFQNALQACFTLHELSHAHWTTLHPDLAFADERDGIPNWKDAPRTGPARKDTVGGDV